MATNEVNNLKERHDHFQSQIAKLVEVSALTWCDEFFLLILRYLALLKHQWWTFLKNYWNLELC
jgi:hypothetical protein